MKHLKKIVALAACATLATSMSASAVQLSNSSKITTTVTTCTPTQSLWLQAQKPLLDLLCGNLANKPVTPNLKPCTPDNKPVAPDTGENDIPVTPDLTPDTPDNKPVAPDTGENDIPNTDNTLSAQAAEVARLVNAERAKQGLSALKIDVRVQSAAQVRATEIEKSFSHTRPNGSSCFTALAEAGASYQGAGENIAWGQKTPAAVMNAWMNSSGHRANILSSKFTTIGVGVAEIGGTLYWTQLFTY